MEIQDNISNFTLDFDNNNETKQKKLPIFDEVL